MVKKNRIEKTYKKKNSKKVKKIIALVSLFVVPAAVIAGIVTVCLTINHSDTVSGAKIVNAPNPVNDQDDDTILIFR